VQTCWLGSYDSSAVLDDWIWAEYWTRYFTDIESNLSWVARDENGQAVGYLTGTADEARFKAYLPRLALGIVWRAIRKRIVRSPRMRRSVRALVGAMVRGDLAISPSLQRRFPAALHINLLPYVRGHALGRRLVETFLRALSARGVHAQTLSANVPAAALFERTGFHLAARRPTRAYAHLDPSPMEIHTWVRA
jgi:ribosomal protein S18 acetylase RimI-like enzyme